MSKKKLVKVRVGAVQMIPTPGDVKGNVEKALRYCDKAASRGVKILCFPECASTGWESGWLNEKACRSKFYGEPVPGPMVDLFSAKAAETDMYIIFGMVEKPLRSQKIYNTAFITGPNEGYIGKQRKVYPEPVFEGATEVNVFQTRYGKIGIFICRDQRSPELSRLLALKGANLFCQPTYYSIPGGKDIKRRYAGKCASQRSRAMENGLHLVVANGGSPHFVNNSRIIGPDWQGPEPVLARATHKEQLLVAEIEYDLNFSKAREWAAQAPWLYRELGREFLKL